MAVAVNPVQRQQAINPLEQLSHGISAVGGIYDIINKNKQADVLGAERDIKLQEMKNQAALQQAKDNPESPENKAFAQAYQAAHGTALPPGMTMGLYERIKYGDVAKEGMASQKSREDLTSAKFKNTNMAPLEERKLRAEAAKIESEINPSFAKKWEKASGVEKEKVGNLTSMLSSLTQLEGEFAKGQRKNLIDANTPYIGRAVSENNVDIITRKLSDDIGRLRSGGAISKDEESRFLKMLPTNADSDQLAVEKFNNFRKEIVNKLQAYGIQEKQLSEIGYDPKSLGFDSSREERLAKSVRQEATGGMGISSGVSPAGLLSGLKNMFGGTKATAADKPLEVKQGGHTYKLNPKTGKYE